VEAAVAEARAGEIDRVTADLLGKMQPVSSLPALTIPTPGEANRTTTTPADPPAAKQIAAAGRVMARLPGDAGDEVVHRCRRLVAEIGEAPTAERGELLVAALRQEVQRANERHDLVASNRAEIERLSRQLDGLDAGLGPDPDGPVAPGGGGSSELDLVRSLRGHLRGVALDVPLPADLADRVERARAAAAAAQDRRFALEVTRDVFEEQGYDLGEDFVTVVATDQGAMLPLAASRRHGVRVREAAGRVSFEVVRFGRTNGGLDDVAAATAFCHSVDAMVERAGRGGLGIADRVYVPPSEGRVVLLDQESPFPEVVQEPPRRRPQQHERQRQR
jgi:hypothetical protein